MEPNEVNGRCVISLEVKHIAAFARIRPDMFCKKAVLKTFAKYTGEHLHWSPVFRTATGLANFT